MVVGGKVTPIDGTQLVVIIWAYGKETFINVIEFSETLLRE